MWPNFVYLCVSVSLSPIFLMIKNTTWPRDPCDPVAQKQNVTQNYLMWTFTGMRHVGNIGDIVYFFGQCCCWVTGSHWSRGSQGFFVGQFCFCDFFSGSQGHAGHVGHVVFLGKILFLGHRVTWITLCVFGKFCFWDTWSRCAFLETQYWVTYVTGAGHVCDPETRFLTKTQRAYWVWLAAVVQLYTYTVINDDYCVHSLQYIPVNLK